jgi:two-component system, response regulator
MAEKIILLVEDNEADEELTARALKKSGIPHELVVKKDGAEALEYLMGSGQHRLPDLVLLDLKLPRVTGLEVLAKLRAEPLRRAVPVVVLSSSRKREDVTAAYGLGCNSYIAKGIDFSLFTEAAECLLQYWLVLNVA